MGKIILRFEASRKDPDKVVGFSYNGKVCFIDELQENELMPRPGEIWECLASREKETVLLVVPLKQIV